MRETYVDGAQPDGGARGSQGVTRAAAGFVCGTQYSDLPVDVVSVSRRCLLDSIGLMIAGCRTAPVEILSAFAVEQGGQAEALLLGRPGVRVPAQMAARVLGTAGHVHDFDDTQVSDDPSHVYGLLMHPSIPALSAAIAVADMMEAVSGREFLTAFNIGFELSCKISEWMHADHYRRGHHSSGTVGTFSACATACSLLGLTHDETRSALGIAASFAAGIRCNFGTMTKPLHVGRAAENGVLAARLAERGYSADADSLDGQWGFAAVLGGGLTPDKTAEGFGQRWSMVEPGVSIKPYPSGILTHQSMDAALRLVTKEDIRPESVQHIDFYAGDNILEPIRYGVARNALEAKFSMAALISMIVLFRSAGLTEFSDEIVTSPAVQRMQERVTTHLDPKINSQGFDQIRSRVEITLTDGRVVAAEADPRYRGGPQWPMTDDEVRSKYDACAATTDPDLASAIAETLNGLPDADSVKPMLDLVRQVSVTSS